MSVGDGETYVIPVEIAEQRYGIRVERFGFDIVEGRERAAAGVAAAWSGSTGFRVASRS